jgi:Zn-dependent protease with chaperone function
MKDNAGAIVFIIPIYFLLHSFMNLFQLTEAKFSRQREKVADLNGAKFTSNKSMANALVKVSFFSKFLDLVEEESIKAIQSNQYITNKVKLFNHIVDTTTLETDKIKQILETNKGSHPLNSHPSLFERLYYLQTDLDDLLKELYISKKEKNAASLIIDIDKFAENISLAEQQPYFEQHK